VHRGLTAARVFGLLGTSLLLAVAAAIVLMVADGGDERTLQPAVAAAPTATPTPKPASRAPARKRMSAQARAARRAAVADVNAEGYSPVLLSSYRPDRRLRVLVAAPTGDPQGGRRAFFFLGRRYVGTDTADNSARIRVLRTGGERWATLQYRLYAGDDKPCCPTGDRVKVRFAWDGTRAAPVDPVPAAELRAVRR
jgi:hypothetical protein